MKGAVTPTERTWNLSETIFSPDHLHHSETIFTIGNGYLGTRGTFEEGYPDQIASTLIHGIFNHHPDDLVPDLANAPIWFAMRILINGKAFRLDQGKILGYHKNLDMRHAVLSRELLWLTPNYKPIRLSFERFASRADPHILAQRVTIAAVEPIEKLEIAAYLDYTHALNIAYASEGPKLVQHWIDVQTAAPSDHRVWWKAKTNQSGYELALAQHVDLDCEAALKAGEIDPSSPGSSFEISLSAGESITLTKYVAIITSRDTPNVVEIVQHKLSEAVEAGYEALKTAHCEVWDSIWEDMDIEIEGDEFVQHALRFATYHMCIAAPLHDEHVSIGAKTLSGPGYKGHVFWDTELFMLPPFTIARPEIAHNLLMYRFYNLQGARNKAKEAGYEGAMYPWESTDTGEETTPRWSLPDRHGNRIRIWTGDLEQHISADIAFAIWQYWQWTGDDAFMRDYGAEILLDTAVFWGSRVEWNPDHERYELSDQIGPDEFHEQVDNPIYTNRMVVWHLEHAFKTLDWLRQSAPDKAQSLIRQLDLSDQRLAHWRDIIAKMYIPRDEERNIYLQFDGFFERKYVDLKQYEPRVTPIDVDLLLGHKQVQASQILKQADVVMLIALLGDELGSHDELMRNWNTYEPRTAHDSSLSPAMHAWVAARLGMVDTAYAYWLKAAGLDLQNNKGNVRDGIHAASTGSLWQAIVFGFVGLQLGGPDGWKLDPQLPPWWKSVKFSFYYQGKKHTVHLTQ